MSQSTRQYWRNFLRNIPIGPPPVPIGDGSQGPPGPKGDKGDPGDPGTGSSISVSQNVSAGTFTITY